MYKIHTIPLALLGLVAFTNADAQVVVKLGFSSPLTGPQVAYGKPNYNGAKMAIDALNASGFTVNGDKVRFELDAQDDQGDPRVGVTVAQKLVDAGVKAVVGPYNSGITLPASKIYNEAGVVIATVSSNPAVTHQGFQYVYRIAASDSQLGGDLGIFAADKLKLKRVAVIDDRTAYGQGVADEFIKRAKAGGVDIVKREYTTDKASDFAGILTTIKASNPDAIFYGGYVAQAAPMRKKMKELGMNGYFLGGDAICDPDMSKVGGPAVDEKVYCTQAGTILGNSESTKNFSDNYKAQFGEAPSSYAISFYDGVMMIANAMRQAKSTEPTIFAKVMATSSFQGSAGDYSFDENRDLKHAPITVFNFAGGNLKSVLTY